MSDVCVNNDGLVRFQCPACMTQHYINIDTDISPSWAWNGSHIAPTFAPSINVTLTRKDGTVHSRCHSFVLAGMIQFLDDCTHALKGQTMPLPEVNVDSYRGI